LQLQPMGSSKSELTEPRQALKRAGAVVDIVEPKSGRIQGMRHHESGETLPVDHIIDEVVSDEYAGLVLPGGVTNPDAPRLNPKVVGFVREFFEAKSGAIRSLLDQALVCGPAKGAFRRG